jgi:hypothetical protein
MPHRAHLQVRDSMVAAARRHLEKRRQHEQRITELQTSEQDSRRRAPHAMPATMFRPSPSHAHAEPASFEDEDAMMREAIHRSTLPLDLAEESPAKRAAAEEARDRLSRIFALNPVTPRTQTPHISRNHP